MAESFTLSLFVYLNFLCTTCVASWLFVPWKRCGRGFTWQSYFTSCPSENTLFRKSTKRQKRTGKYCKHLLRRRAIAILGKKIAAGWRLQIFFVGDKSHLRWQVPLDKPVNLSSSLDKFTCVLPSYPTWNHLTSCNLSKSLLNSTFQSSYHASVGPWKYQTPPQKNENDFWE